MNGIKGFWWSLCPIKTEWPFIGVLQQFQTSSVRHQAHTDQHIENIESGQIGRRWKSESKKMNRLREQTGEMMGQREGQKVEKWLFELDLNFCESREEREYDEKFYRRQTF